MSEEERRQLEKDLMGIFDPNRPYNICTTDPNEEQTKSLLMTAAALGTSVTYDEVCSNFAALSREQELAKLSEIKVQALMQLGFSSEDSLMPTNKFLQRLLPNVEKNKRISTMVDALERIIPVYANLFVKGGNGWPTKHLSSLMDVEITERDKSMARVLLMDTHECMSFKKAIIIAPYILSWHKISTSPQMRGSLSIKRTSEKRTGAPSINRSA